MTLNLTEYRGHPVIEDHWNLLHRHSVGLAGEALLAGIERGELIAARCPDCDRLQLPPRSFCERCFKPTTYEPFPGRTGELLSFTVIRRGFTDSPDAPFAIGYARLEGAATAIGTLIGGVDLSVPSGDLPLTVGMPVELAITDEGIGFERLRLMPSGAR